MLEVIPDSQPKQRTIQRRQLSIWNKLYVTLWLQVRNCLFWFLKRKMLEGPAGAHTRLEDSSGEAL